MDDHQVEVRSMWQKVRPAVILTALYTFAHGLLLLNRGLYWDGLYFFLLLKEKEFGILFAQLERVKVYSLYYVIRVLDIFPDPVFAFKAMAFFSWLIAGLALYAILRRTAELSERRAIFISGMFLVFPAFLVRPELSVIHYSLSVMLFYVAAFLFFWAQGRTSVIFRYSGYVISWLLFFFSFFTNSLLVFYAGFLALLLYRKTKSYPGIRTWPWWYQWMKQSAVFIIIPIIFWVVRALLGKPYGELAHYNEFIFLRPGALGVFFNQLWNGMVYGFFWPLVAPFTILDRKIFVSFLIIVFVILSLLILRISKRDTVPEENDTTPRFLWYSGLFLYTLGLFPYLVVGKAPHIFGLGFGMRHALLLSLGASFLIYAGIRTIVKGRWQGIAQVLLLSLSCVFTVYNYYRFDMDWYRQRAIVLGLQDAHVILERATTLLFNDATVGYAYQRRIIGPDEYRSYVYQAFGKNNFKFAALAPPSGTDISQYVKDEYTAFTTSFILPFPSAFNPGKNIVTVSVASLAGHDLMTVFEWLKLKRYELFFSKTEFENVLRNDFRIAIVPRI